MMDRIPGGDDTEFGDLPRKTLLRPAEVAVFLSVSLKTIYRWYRAGVLNGTKVNGIVRIYRDSVLRLIRGDADVSSCDE